jgi:hypothetical protein
MSPCIASGGGLKRGQIPVCRGAMPDYAQSIVFRSISMLEAKVSF